MHVLHAPAGRHEFIRQIIEQLGMRGTLAHAAEIVRRSDDSAAEVILPHAIHHHPRGKRILIAHHPLRQFGARLRRRLRQLGSAIGQQDAERPHAHAVALGRIFAAREQMDLAALRGIVGYGEQTRQPDANRPFREHRQPARRGGRHPPTPRIVLVPGPEEVVRQNGEQEQHRVGRGGVRQHTELARGGQHRTGEESGGAVEHPAREFVGEQHREPSGQHRRQPRRPLLDLAKGQRTEPDGSIVPRRLGQERFAIEYRVKPMALEALGPDDRPQGLGAVKRPGSKAVEEQHAAPRGQDERGQPRSGQRQPKRESECDANLSRIVGHAADHRESAQRAHRVVGVQHHGPAWHGLHLSSLDHDKIGYGLLTISIKICYSLLK